MVTFDLDLGLGYRLLWFTWEPDRSIPSNAERYAGVADVPIAGATLWKQIDGEWRSIGAMWFDMPEARAIPGFRHFAWQVESWEPLTLSPSILCRETGDHGFIRGGQWVPA